jgi:Flp pilus assembly protein TadD
MSNGLPWRVPAAALAAVFVVKLVVALQLDAHPLLQPDAGLDTGAYTSLARRVVAGDVALGPGLYYVSPLYIYFLACVLGLAGSFTAARVVQAALGALAVACVFVMARDWAGRRAAWGAAALAALCGVLTFHEALLMQSSIDAVLTAGALTLLTRALLSHEAAPPARVGATSWFVLSGLVFGLQTLNRPNVLAAAVAIGAALVVVRRWRGAAALAIGLLIGLAPVTIRNVVVAGEWSLVSSHGGLNFYIGNHEAATGYYQTVPGVRPDIVGQQEDTRRVAEAAIGRPLSDADVSAYFSDQAWTWIRAQPVAAAALTLKKFALAFHADYSALPHSFEFFADDAGTALRWLVAGPWLVVPLGLSGLVVAWPARRPREFAVWALFVPAYAAGLALFFVSERYRLPLIPPLAVAAGMFIDRAIDLVRGVGRADVRGRAPAVAAAVAAAAFAFVNWPIPLPDSREGDRLRMVQIDAAAGRHDEADRVARRAVAAAASPARVHEVAGRAFLQAGQIERALGHLRSAFDLGSRSPEAVIDLADAQLQSGRAGEVASTLRAVAWPDPPDPSALTRAGRVAAAAGAHPLAEDLLGRATALDPTRAEAWAQLGFSRLFSRAFEAAVPAFEQAVRLDPRDAVALGGLAVCEANLGRRDAALAHARQALSIDPNERLAQQVLAALGKD